MRKRRTLDDVIRFTTTVGESTSFTGSLSGGESFVIRGKVRGDSVVNGVVVITETGSWNGSLRAETIVVAGKVDGVVEAKEKLEILSTAKIKGRISSPVIAIATGAVHEGEIQMQEETRITEFSEKRTISAQPDFETE